VRRRTLAPLRTRRDAGRRQAAGHRSPDQNLGVTMRRTLLLALSLLALPVQALELKPFSASYTADWKQVPISGTAQRSLEKTDGDLWRLAFEASMLVASLNERSTFRVDGDTLLAQPYRLKRSGLGKRKNSEHKSDRDAKEGTGEDSGEPVKLPTSRGLLDKSTYQIALQEAVAAGEKIIIYKEKTAYEIETYDFRVLGEEQVSTKAGQVDAIKVERVRDPTQSKRQTILWFATEWDYL